MMGKDDFKYHAVRLFNDGSVNIHTLLPSDFQGPFRSSQDGLAVMLDCGADCEDKSWADHVAAIPALAGFTFTGGNRPSYLSAGCEDLTLAEAEAIVNTYGASGSTWFSPSELN